MSNQRIFLIIAVCSAVLLFTRALPFIFFGGGRKIPAYINYLGAVLPPGIMAILIIYCLKGASFGAYPFALPEVLAVFVVVLLYLWKKSAIISIMGATFLYMFLVQTVFA